MLPPAEWHSEGPPMERPPAESPTAAASPHVARNTALERPAPMPTMEPAEPPWWKQRPAPGDSFYQAYLSYLAIGIGARFPLWRQSSPN